MNKVRTEQDSLGVHEIPAGAYWGIHTARALEHFGGEHPLTPRALIHAFGLVKKACCKANQELGFLNAEDADAISAACDEVAAGKLDDQFPVSAWQGGAGTSTNMNVNEVIANRALELLGRPHGDYDRLHPLDHVNLHQSTNDTYPTALKVAATCGVRALSGELARAQGVFQQKEKEFAGIVKLGRTEMQGAVPLTLGREFSAFGDALARDRWRTFKCEERLRVVNLGGTAIGTGVAAPRPYIFLVIERLRELSGVGVTRGENAVDQTANVDALVEVSGILKACAATTMKIADDLRLLAMLGEIRLPAVQQGSSIMPGKYNPVMLEHVIQLGLNVFANDGTVASCASRGTLQICEFLPLLAQALLESIELTTQAAGRLADHVDDIQANEEVCRSFLHSNPAIITPLLPEIGYDRATELLKDFENQEGGDLRAFLEAELGNELVATALSAEQVSALGYRPKTDKPEVNDADRA